MTDLTIQNINHSKVRIDCEESIAWELRDTFCFQPPNYQFTPKYKLKIWDGFIRCFQPRTRTIQRGLINRVIDWADTQGYTWTYEDQSLEDPFSVIEAQEFIQQLNPKHQPYEHQLNAFIQAIQSKRIIIESATSSGKSLLLYLICMYLIKQGKKGLLIVPRTQLVEQMYSDFEDYSVNNKKDMSKYLHRIYSGKEKHSDFPITISTWQSLQHLPSSYFSAFDYLLVDEAHGAVEKAQDMKVLSKILDSCINSEYRIGVTGTIPDGPYADLSLTGLFGEKYKATSASELMENKQIADLKIKCLLLRYTPDECKYISKVPYAEEIDYIIGHKERNQFITNLALSLDGNTLLLFNYVDKHGKILYNMLKDKMDQVGDTRKIFFIHGGTDVEDREEMRRIVEKETRCIIVGSSGVLSTGSNIVNLDNAIFASPNKSKVRTLQSVGRILRKSDSKTKATLFDIVDDFSHKKHLNFALKHFMERVKIYSIEKFKYKIYKISLNRSSK